MIQTARDWRLTEEELTRTRAEAFRVIKAPALLLYNKAGDEIARVIGDVNIGKFVQCYGDDLR